MPRTKSTRTKKNLQPKLVAPNDAPLTAPNGASTNGATSKQQLSSVIKSARDIMRKDAGLNGDLDRLPQLSWVLFLKSYDDLEVRRETEAIMQGAPYKSVIPVGYRWRDWAADENKGRTGEELLNFVNNDLLPKLRSLNETDEQLVIAQLFGETNNRMLSGYLLRDVVNLVAKINFNSSDDIHTLSHLYESMLKEMRDAAGDSGEFYTPRPVVRFMVERVAPKLGERVLDPACGTGGFLVETFEYLYKQQHTAQDREILQTRSLFGVEKKPMPFLLGMMNLLLHGIERPNVRRDNALKNPLREIGDAERFDVIVTNPPFGGEEEKGIQDNFPSNTRAAETAILFMQFIMRSLKQGGRGAVVVPNGTLFGDGVTARVKEMLLTEFNLHTIVRLPNGVFAPYTSIPTNLLFFDKTEPTREIWYYELPLPEGRKNYTKTQPLQFEEFAACAEWWSERVENERAWKFDFRAAYDKARTDAKPFWDAAQLAEANARDLARRGKEIEDAASELLKAKSKEHDKIALLNAQRAELRDQENAQWAIAREQQQKGDAIYWAIYNLDLKNPNRVDDYEHMPPEQLAADILEKEKRIAEIMGEIQQVLIGEA
ncbi:SAM-dependent DNA methyltransferase [Anaerolineae bacterium CFX7]|nr:SAM-dependent DNA methyltransferase [Anaerolineae bacterium CFX7]